MAKTITKTYSGKTGQCLCGCQGTWTYTDFGANNWRVYSAPDHSLAQDITVDDRTAKAIAKKVLEHPFGKFNPLHNCQFVEQGDQLMAVYFA